MKVIIILFGHIRTFRETIKNTLYILNQHPTLEVEWHIHTWTQIEHSDYCWWNESLKKNNVDYIINYTESPAYKEWNLIRENYPNLNIKRFIIEDYKLEKDNNRIELSFPKGLTDSSYFHAYKKLTPYLNEYPENTPVLRIRPDSSFDSTEFTRMANAIVENPDQIFSHTVGHGTYGYCCDILYITSLKILRKLAIQGIVKWLDNSNHSMPETRFGALLISMNVPVIFFDSYLYLLRMNGSIYYYNHNNPKKI